MRDTAAAGAKRFGYTRSAQLNTQSALPAVSAPNFTVDGDTLRIRPLPRSAMKRFPEASTVTPEGTFNDAEVAGPPSPEKPKLPLPATVLMPLGLVDTSRIRLALVPGLSASVKKRFPE